MLQTTKLNHKTEAPLWKFLFSAVSFPQEIALKKQRTYFNAYDGEALLWQW